MTQRTLRKQKEAKVKKNRWQIALVLVIGICMALAACGGGATTTSGNGEGLTPEVKDVKPLPEGDENDVKEENMSDKPVIEITMENGGKIAIELDPEAAPVTVANFLKLVDENYYDGLTFHRIIPNFMIQGGCPDGTGMGGPDEKIKGEFSSNGWDNPISHKRGVISMARSGDPNSAGSQFFITNTGAEFLDGDYAAFGHVISGMEVVDEISAVATGANDKPNTPVVIQTIRRK